MPAAVASQVLLASPLVAAGAMVLLAGWLLWLNFRSTVNRSFAIFLLFRAFVTIANVRRGVTEAAGEVRSVVFWQAIREYYNLALIPVLLYFFVAYKGSRRRALLRAGIVALAVLTESLYLLDHCLDLCTLSDGRIRLGFLALVGFFGFGLAMGLVGLAILRESLRYPSASRQRAAFPVAVGILLTPLLEVSVFLGLALRFGLQRTVVAFEPSVWVNAAHVTLIAGTLPALVGLVWTAWAARRAPQLRTKAWLFASGAVLIAASGLYVGWNGQRGVNWLPGIFLLGLWRILLPALVAYALVRHRLFGVEVRLKWTLVRASMAFVFLAVFFVAAQLAQNYLSDAYGWGLGGIAAGLLLFAVSPLQRAAERFTHAVLPHTMPVGSMTQMERLDLFRHQAVLVWSDGVMGRKERSLLDALRHRLAIPHEDAARIEGEAAAQSSLPRIPHAPGRSSSASK